MCLLVYRPFGQQLTQVSGTNQFRTVLNSEVNIFSNKQMHNLKKPIYSENITSVVDSLLRSLVLLY